MPDRLQNTSTKIGIRHMTVNLVNMVVLSVTDVALLVLDSVSQVIWEDVYSRCKRYVMFYNFDSFLWFLIQFRLVLDLHSNDS